MSKQDYKELLPWLVNESLSEAEAAELETTLNEDHALQKEQAFLTALHQSIKQQNVQSPGSLGLARLKRDLKKSSNPTPMWWKPAMLAACIVIAVQTGLLINQPNQTLYQPLSGQTHHTTVLQITFTTDARESEIRQILNDIDGSIIAGPGAMGIYHVALPKDATIELAVQTLKNNAVIEDVIQN